MSGPDARPDGRPDPLGRALQDSRPDLAEAALRETTQRGPPPDAVEAWRLLAERYHLFRGTPSRMWLDWVFGEAFGIDVQLSAETSDLYYDRITAALATEALLWGRGVRP